MKEPTNLKDLFPTVLHGRDICAADAKIVAQKHSNGKKRKLTLVLSWDEDARPTNHCNANGFLTCDGPRHEKRTPREVHSMGHCDHYICVLCYKIHTNSDGSFGCSAFDCMRANIYGNVNDNDAWKQYNSTVVATYLDRKSLYEKGQFKFDHHIRSVSNPSSRSPKSAKFLDSREVVERSQTAVMIPVEFPINIKKDKTKITVRALIYHLRHSHPSCTVLVHSFSQGTDLTTAIKYVLKKVLGTFNGFISGSFGTSESHAVFLPLENSTIQKTLVGFAGTGGKLNLIIDTLEKLKL